MQQPTALVSALSDNLASLPFLLPEGFLAATLCLVLALGVWLPQHQRYWLRPLALAGLFLAMSSKYGLGHPLRGQYAVSLFNQLLILDPLAIFFSLLLLGITILWVLWAPLLSRQLNPDPAAPPVYIMLVLGTLLGSVLLVMAFHWLTLYLGLTLISLSSALLIGSHEKPIRAVASLKYLLYSMVTTAIMLWALGYLYGCTGTLHLAPPNHLALRLQALPSGLVYMMLLLCLSSLLFILAAAPYHFWLPDVYRNTNPSTVAYLATVPKLAVVAVLWRLFQQYLPLFSPVLQAHAQQGLTMLALLTLIIGHSAAILQNNLQRLLAYGTIAQGGLLLVGIVALPSSQLGLLYYSVLYALISLAAWFSVQVLQHLTGGDMALQSCTGLGRQFPGLGISITVVMIALVGLPPTAGFTGKFLLLAGLWDHAQRTDSMLAMMLFVVSLAGTVFSLFYYLKLPYVLFAKADVQTLPTSRSVSTGMVFIKLLAAFLLAAFWLGSSWLSTIWPE